MDEFKITLKELGELDNMYALSDENTRIQMHMAATAVFAGHRTIPEAIARIKELYYASH